MANIGGKNFTTFQNIRVNGERNGSGGAGVIRFVATSGLESTLSVNTTYQDSNYQWTLPARSGGIPTAGTFTVNLPAVSGGNYYETAVAVSGLRAEDLFLVQMVTPNETVTTNRGRTFFAGVSKQSDGFATLMFFNPTATATIYGDHTMAYVAFR